MPAYATCKFPLVDRWKRLGDKNAFVGYIDSVLSGFAQIAFSDNPFCGALLIIGACIGSPIQAISGVWAACIATLIAYLLGTPKLQIRLGLYSFNAALAGLGIPLFAFSNKWMLPEILFYSSIGAIACVLLTAGLSALFSGWDVPSLALPYCITLFILIPASLFLSGIKAEPSSIPHLVSPAVSTTSTWSINDFFTSIMTGLSEIIWQANVISGFFYLLAVLVSSRIDVFSAISSVTIGTLSAIALGLSKDEIMIGLYGYNAVLLTQVLFGRAYRLSLLSFIFSSVLSVVSVLLAVALSALFAPIGAPVAAFPYVILTIVAMVGRNAYTKLVFVSPLKWGVPETIENECKKTESKFKFK